MTAHAPDRDDFWRFVAERDRIRLRREGGAPEPWTEDPTLRDYHFTNVHRSHDPGTRWIVRTCESRGWVDLPDVLFAAYVYRSLNRVSTFERHGFPWPDELCAATWTLRLDAARAAGDALGSGRHLTYWARLRTAVPTLLRERDAICAEVEPCLTGADVIRALQRFPLFVGVFLGTQVVADLAEIGASELRFGRDVSVPVSGGSRFGLGLATGTLTEDERARHAYADRTASGRRQRELASDPREARLFGELLASQPTSLSSRLFAVDLEHSLCEFARYWRLSQGDYTRQNYLKRRPHEGEDR